MTDSSQHSTKTTGTGRGQTEDRGRVRLRAAGRDRQHARPGRSRQLKLRLSVDEHADVAAAARSAGLTPTGYAAEAALAAAREDPPPLPGPLRMALADLLDARIHLRRFGTNVHLAAGAMHRGGRVPDDLLQAISDAARAIARVDEAAAAITASLR